MRSIGSMVARPVTLRRLRNSCLALIAGYAFFSPKIGITQRKPEARLRPSHFHDHFVPGTVPVSSLGIIKGVLVTAPDSKVDLQGLGVWLPSSGPRHLCLNIETIDGRYTATADYDLSTLASGRIILGVETGFKQQLSGYTARQMAVNVLIATRCGDSDGIVMPAGWTTARTNSLVIFVNSEGAEDVYLWDPASRKNYNCHKAPSSNLVAWDTECPIPLPQQLTTNWPLILGRRNLQNPLKDIPVTIAP